MSGISITRDDIADVEQLIGPRIRRTPIVGWPDVKLIDGDHVAAAFKRLGVMTTRDAARLIWRLSYGRSSDPENHLLVLSEGRGTCSGKHAILAMLAVELGLPVELILTFYEMNEMNTPGVGAVLEAHGLCSILEAHCLLRYKGDYFDFTGLPGKDPSEPKRFVHSEVITPAQVCSYKLERHRRFLQEWLEQSQIAGLDLDRAWSIREACIKALAARVADDN